MANSSKMNINSIRKVIILVSMALMVAVCVESSPARRPRFIAIPLEDVQLVEVEDLPNAKARPGTASLRLPRQVTAETQNDQDAARFERQAGHDHHHEYVDFGAHTGHHGSFGWYADFPVKDPGH